MGSTAPGRAEGLLFPSVKIVARASYQDVIGQERHVHVVLMACPGEHGGCRDGISWGA